MPEIQRTSGAVMQSVPRMTVMPNTEGYLSMLPKPRLSELGSSRNGKIHFVRSFTVRPFAQE